MIDITFLNLPNSDSCIMTCYPPIGILSMAAVLKKNYYSVNYIDADVLRLSVEDVVNKLKNTPPRLLGVTVNVSHVKFVDKYVIKIQEEFPDLVIIIGGHYTTSKKDCLLHNIITQYKIYRYRRRRICYFRFYAIFR
jgi:hypothetical protein